MKISKILIITGLLFGFGSFVFAQTPVSDSGFDIKSPRPEIHINKDGRVLIEGAKIMQFVGNTMYARVIWDNIFLRIVVKTDQNTSFVRRYGEAVNISNIAVGNYLSIEGSLESNADSLSIIAAKIKNLSDLTQQNNFSGTILAIDPSYKSFSLNSKTLGVVQVVLDGSTSIVLGSRAVGAFHLKVGDNITSVNGVYDHGTKILKADKIVVYINMSIFKAKNRSGVLKSMSGKTLPANLVVTINSEDYTVKLSEETQIINNRRKDISLSRFIEGDSIVFYGALQETDELIVDSVEIIRNASL